MTHPRNAALLHQPDGFDTGRPNPMGRHAANEGSIKTFVRHSAVDAKYCYTSPRAAVASGSGCTTAMLAASTAMTTTAARPASSSTSKPPPPTGAWPAMRHGAGAWARQHAHELFDCPVVFARCRRLWRELAGPRGCASWPQLPLFACMAARAPTEAECAALQRQGPRSVAQLPAGIPAERREALERCIDGRAKLGLLSVAAPPG